MEDEKRRAAHYANNTQAACAFVATNSIAQGEQVARLWPLIFARGLEITFAHTSFKWTNLASNNAGVTVAIIGLGRKGGSAVLFETSESGVSQRREVYNINPYLVPHAGTVVEAEASPLSSLTPMVNGN